MKGLLYPYNKFNNKKTKVGGYTYDSKLEADYGELLDKMVLAKEIKEYKRQVHLKLEVTGVPICKYFIDFVITHNDGRLELLEAKGFQTKEWLIKWALTKALLPTGAIHGIPADSKLTLVKRGKRGEFIHEPQFLNY